MADKTKNRLLIMQTILLIVIVIFNGIYFGPKVINRIKIYLRSSQYLSVNDNISDLELYDIDNKKTELKNEYKFIVYLSADCGTCINHRPLLKKINETFGKDPNIIFMIIWEDKFPEDFVLDYYGFRDCSYSAKNFYAAKSYNTVFIADKDNKIVFAEEAGYEGAFDYILSLDIIDKEQLILNTNAHIISDLVRQYDDKNNLIYFSMPGCPDCSAADPIIYGKEITDRFNITRIELTKGAEAFDFKDDYNIYKRVYDIDWYPSFLIINEDNSWDIVRKVDPEIMAEKILEN